MKKLLGMFGVIGLCSSSATTVACNKKQEPYQGYTDINFPWGNDRKTFAIDPTGIYNLNEGSDNINSNQVGFGITYADAGIIYSINNVSNSNEERLQLAKEQKELYAIYNGDLKINNYKSEGLIGIVS